MSKLLDFYVNGSHSLPEEKSNRRKQSPSVKVAIALFLLPNSLLYVGGKDKDKWCKKAFLLLQ